MKNNKKLFDMNEELRKEKGIEKAPEQPEPQP